jgi:hypothetical protein
MMAVPVAIAGGSIAARLARLERSLLPEPEPDGDPFVLILDDPEGGPPEVRGRIGPDTFVLHLAYRDDGPQ